MPKIDVVPRRKGGSLVTLYLLEDGEGTYLDLISYFEYEYIFIVHLLL